MRILYANLWDNYTLVESQEDANYPAENTQDMRLSKVWRTATASATTIYIDAGSGLTITCDTAAILAHNFTASAGIVVQASTAATFATIHLSANVTYRSDIMVVFFASGAHRFWRFSFNETTNPDGYYQIGRLMLGAYLQVDPSSLVEFPEDHVRSDRQQFSVTNQLYADIGVGHKEYRYSFEYANASAKTLMQTMWDTSGRHGPFLFLNYDETYTVIPPVYCVLTEDMTFTHLLHDFWKFDMKLREVD